MAFQSFNLQLLESLHQQVSKVRKVSFRQRIKARTSSGQLSGRSVSDLVLRKVAMKDRLQVGLN